MNTATKPDHNLNLVLFTSYFKLSQKHLSFLFCTVFPPVFAAEGGDKLQIHAQSAAPTDWQPSTICSAGLLCGCALSYFMSHVNLLPALRLRVNEMCCGENKGRFSVKICIKTQKPAQSSAQYFIK